MIEKQYFGENKNIEFKRQLPSNHEKFLKDIIAFANSSGGKVILGIEDETNIVYGIGDQSPFKLSDRISNMISDTCTPQIDSEISIQTVEDKTILVIDVLPGKFRPYYMANKEKETTVYIRINGTSRPADAKKIKELELEGQNLSYDSMQLIGTEYDEALALNLCKEMQRIALKSCKSDDERADVKEMTIEKLEDFGLLRRSGEHFAITHAFDLMTENKHKYAKIQCALFKGLTRDVFIDQKVFTGPIHEQVDSAYQFILRHIDMGAEINGVYRNDTYELPINAIREMVANAIVHRSYLDESCVQVCIFDDRVEVLSPGTLYGGLDIETVKKGKSRCRNGAIAEAFHYMHIIEAWGTGIPRMINRCKEYGLREPVFEEFGDSFKVTMYRKVSNALQRIGNAIEKVVNDMGKEVNDEQKVSNAFDKYLPMLLDAKITKRFVENIQIVFEKCGEGEMFGQANVIEWLQCSKSKATNIMNAMKKAKIIEKVKGFGPGKYQFVKM